MLAECQQRPGGGFLRRKELTYQGGSPQEIRNPVQHDTSKRTTWMLSGIYFSGQLPQADNKLL